MGFGWSIHKNDGWQGQLERVHRWHDRLKQAERIGSDDLWDFTFTFFQNCYHLREWLEKTSSIPKADLDSLFSSTQELRLCRDICNGTKHYTLRNASVDKDFSILREYDPNTASKSRMILIADEKYDLLELASRCVDILDNFIKLRFP